MDPFALASTRGATNGHERRRRGTSGRPGSPGSPGSPRSHKLTLVDGFHPACRFNRINRPSRETTQWYLEKLQNPAPAWKVRE